MGQQHQHGRKVVDHRPQPERRDRLIQEKEHDPYKPSLKPADPGVCTICHAVYEEGRWHWGARPAAASDTVCQACQRIRDHIPAGILTMDGAFVRTHRAELLAQVRHQETLESSEHPLNRIMDIRDTSDGMTVTTTDLHLPRRVAEALRSHHHGEVTWQYDDDDYFLRVHWQAD
ncbi:BCAM0308 family protein [Azospirillum endophyticum]